MVPTQHAPLKWPPPVLFLDYLVPVRADRLVAIVVLLQARGRLTAAALAEQLETSERTIRRDLDALCMAGVPLYPQRGRGGGWALVGGYRTDLTGLTADEAEALFLTTAPGAAATLGPRVAEALAAARRKLVAALPAPLRDQVEAAASTVLVDRAAWGRPPAAADQPLTEDAHLRTLRAAVLAGMQVVVTYEPPGRPAEDRQLHPHGLVCKRGVWYLLATAPNGLRTYRLTRVRSVETTDMPVERPADFDLAAAWAGVQQRLSARIPVPVAVEVAVGTAALRRLRTTVGAWWRIEETGTCDDQGAVVTIRFPSVTVAAAELLAVAGQAEIISPETVRAEIAATGHRLALHYGHAGPLPLPN